MSNIQAGDGQCDYQDGALGDNPVTKGIVAYIIGLALAALLTAASFVLARTDILYGPSLPVGLIVLAIAQTSIHLVYFLHLTTAPNNTNNIMALLFDAFFVFLVIGGSIWIMGHLNRNMMPTSGGM